MRPKEVPLTNDSIDFLGAMQHRPKACPKEVIMNYQQGVVKMPSEG